MRWQFTFADDQSFPNSDRLWTKTIDLASHQITLIKVHYEPAYGQLYGLIFYSGDNQIAKIGYTNATFAMITLEKGEILCGVSTSNDDGVMSHFKFITATLK